MTRQNKLIWTFVVIFAIICATIPFYRGEKDSSYHKIGAILDLTGPVAPYGQWSKNGLELALEEINYPQKKLDLIIEDGNSSTQSAISSFNKLIDIDKVKVVIITTGSSAVLSVAPLANRNKVILFTPAASAPEITEAGDFIFRNRLSGLQETREMAQIAYEKLKLKQGAIFIVNNDFGQSYLSVFEKTFDGLGGKIRDTETFEQGSADFRTQLTKLKYTPNIDFVYLVGYAIDCAQILKQAKELGVASQWLSTIGIESEQVIDIAKNAADGVIYTAPKYRLDDPSVIPFEKMYMDKYHEHSNMYAANSYDALKIISDIINKVGYDPDEIRTALYNTKNYPGVSGLTTFDENGDVEKPVMLKVIRNGKFVIYDLK